MSCFRCDWEKKNGMQCGRKPFVEAYPFKEEDITEEEDREKLRVDDWEYEYPKFEGWSYLCLRHFIMAKLRGDQFAWCRVDSNRELMENIREELWDIQEDFALIKEKLKIKEEGVEELEKLLEEDNSGYV